MYRDLLKSGWTIQDIDEMDIRFFLEVTMEEETEPEMYIDELRW